MNPTTLSSARFFGFAASSALVSVACGSSSSNHATPGPDGGLDASVSSDAAVSNDAAQAPDVPNLPNTDAGAVTGLPAQTWKWVPFDQAQCRDGTPTGIAINANPASDKLVIFLQGGGACFNQTTCNFMSTRTYGVSNYNQQFGADGTMTAPGILDRTNTANPVKDWNYVYVPYCTGDVFAGNAKDVMVPGVGTQQFVGYANMHLFLQRIVPTFSSVKQVLLTGVSAGGFGAAANLYQTSKAFGSVPVYELDDSGPSFDAPDIASCLLDTTRQLWGIENTLLAECGSSCPPDRGNYQSQYAHFVRKAYPNVPDGLIDTVADGVITLFFGFGANNCAPVSVPTGLTQAQYTAGLDHFRAEFASDPKVGSFIFGDDAACNCATQHTSLGGATFYTVTSTTGVKLVDWVTALVNGTVTNVGP